MAEIPRAQDQLFDGRSSARDKYARLVVGRAGLGALLKHEAVVLCSQHVPVPEPERQPRTWRCAARCDLLRT